MQREPVLVPGVDQLIGGRRDRGEDPQPGEWIGPLPQPQRAARDGRPTDTVETVTTRDHIGAQPAFGSRVAIGDDRLVSLQSVDGHASHSNCSGAPESDPRLDQIFGHLGLPVDRHRSSGQLVHRDAMVGPVEAQVDPPVDQALALQPLTDARFDERVARALLKDAGSDPRLAVGTAPSLDDHRLHTMPVQEMAQQQTGRPGADDRDLRARWICHRSTVYTMACGMRAIVRIAHTNG